MEKLLIIGILLIIIGILPILVADERDKDEVTNSAVLVDRLPQPITMLNIESVIDSVWRNTGTLVFEDGFVYQKFQKSLRHYLRLRINGETYRIELIKEE